MCTLLLLRDLDPAWPLAVAANRDERTNRPASPPTLWSEGPVGFVAPRDSEAGGTWIGLSACGLFAGVTNRFGRNPDRARRSRGELVPMALAEPSARAAWAMVRALKATDYNGFHLLVADRDAAFLICNEGDRLHGRELGPGRHLVTERSLGAGESARERWLEAETAQARSLDALVPLLARHAEPPVAPLDGGCVHLPGGGYGTRSSSLVSVGGSGRLRFLYADGPPCVTPYVDLSGLFASVPQTGTPSPGAGR